MVRTCIEFVSKLEPLSFRKLDRFGFLHDLFFVRSHTAKGIDPIDDSERPRRIEDALRFSENS